MANHSFRHWNNCRLNHIICGDLNPPSWQDGYEEWIGESGLWELSDPTIPTFPSGNALDRFLLAPGEHLWEALLPDPIDSMGDNVDADLGEGHYPAIVLPPHPAKKPLSAHHPVYLDLPFMEENTQQSVRSLMTGKLTPEKWSSCNEWIAERLHNPQHTQTADNQSKDANRMYEYIRSMIATALADCYTRGGEQPPRKGPFELFCERNAEHPRLNHLRMAEKTGDKVTFSRLVKEISGDAWSAFLNKTRVSNLSKMFQFIARRDGRVPPRGTFCCAAPLSKNGNYYYGGAAKCEVLATHFADRLSAPPDGPRCASIKCYMDAIQRAAPKEAYPPITTLEVRKAINSLSPHKAPGPDTIPAEVFKNLPALQGPLAQLFTLILQTGVFPRGMLQLYIIPLDKPGKPRNLCTSKRPISLLCTISKILETVILHRMLPLIEPHLSPKQFAYRRGRGTEMHLAELSDFAAENVGSGKYVYLSSLDIDGAFDSVPHHLLVRALHRFGVDGYTKRYVATWLTQRSFRMRLKTNSGPFFSGPRPISRGLPQGGVLSPLLWLVIFNDIQSFLEEQRKKEPETFAGAIFLDLIYADDITSLFAHEDASRIPSIAQRNAQLICCALLRLELKLSAPKSYNFVISPGLVLHGAFRRVPNSHTLTNMGRPLLDQQNMSGLEDLSTNELLEKGIFPPELRPQLPFEWRDKIRVLGVLLDPLLTYTDHIQSLIRRARVRHSVMTSLSRSNWGLETGILRATHNALLVSLTRYGFVTVGSGAYESDMKTLETRHTNLAARRVLGLGTTARLETLFATADLLSAHNLYIRS